MSRCVGAPAFAEPEHTLQQAIHDSRMLLLPYPNSPFGQELMEQAIRNHVCIMQALHTLLFSALEKKR